MSTDRKILRRMGLLKDQEGIMKRYLRENEGWKQHLENSRNFLLDSFPADHSDSRNSGMLLLLGSGWLLDVPLEELQKRFHTLCLADLHHPPQIRKKAEKMKGIKLVEADLSGGAISQTYAFIRGGSLTEDQFLEGLRLSNPLEEFAPTALASVNLLSQLDGLLLEYMGRSLSLSSGFREAFRKRIQDFHVDWITTTPGCLITDTRECFSGRSGKQEFRELLGTTLPDGQRSATWTWDFDRSGNYHSGALTTMEVNAVQWG